MTWIESHSELRDHPKRKRLSRKLGLDLYQTIGLLNCLWWWVMDYAPDGDLSRFDSADIADGLDFPGDPDELMGALRFAGFVDGDLVHDWDAYGEKLFRRREANAQRMRAARAEHVQNTCRTHAEREDRQDRTEESTNVLLSDETPDQPIQVPIITLARARFEHWRNTFPQETARMTFTKDRERTVTARLREGIAPETIDRAIDNARGDPWWNGAKDGEWKADIKTICGKGSTVEKLAAKGQQRSGLERLRAQYGDTP